MSMSYICFRCEEMSRRLMPKPYMLRIRGSRFSASTVSRFFTICGSKLEERSRDVSSSMLPSEVRTCFLTLPLRRLPLPRSSESR